MTNSDVATGLQDQLTERWAKAEKFLDTSKPLTPAFWQSMANYWSLMDAFDKEEKFIRAEGHEGCIREDDCSGQVVSCEACVR